MKCTSITNPTALLFTNIPELSLLEGPTE